MIIQRIYNDHLAQASYLVGCTTTGDALVIDPNRDIEQYLTLAAQEGLRVSAVTETHIHADFVSGARELAAVTGAQLYLSDTGPDAWKYEFAAESGATLLHGGDCFDIGSLSLDVLHTPGHTPEHLSFVLTDTAVANEPVGIFTGDFVFVGDVGRPDLLELAAGYANTMHNAARQLYGSLQRFRELPPDLVVWPGHGAGSACGRSLGTEPCSTVEQELRCNWAFGECDEAAFVAAVLSDQPPAPRYFAQMKRVNKTGARPVAHLALPPQLEVEQLATHLNDSTFIIDLRPPAAFAAGHIPGMLSLPSNGALLTWAGWLVPYDRQLALIVDENDFQHIVRQLRLIGLDNLMGYWRPEVLQAWAANGHELQTIERIDVHTLQQRLVQNHLMLLDVRTAREYASGSIDGSQNIPLNELSQRLDEVPRDQPVAVHCQSGMRSAIAASLLTAAGYRDVADVQGGFAAWAQMQG